MQLDCGWYAHVVDAVMPRNEFLLQRYCGSDYKDPQTAYQVFLPRMGAYLYGSDIGGHEKGANSRRDQDNAWQG